MPSTSGSIGSDGVPNCKADFLDVSITAHLLQRAGSCTFALQHKPSSMPQYNVWRSDHRHSHRSNICVGEAEIILMLGSPTASYYQDVLRVDDLLNQKHAVTLAAPLTLQLMILSEDYVEQDSSWVLRCLCCKILS